ncbi:MAG: acylphosphatase [Brockia lithotrophica]|nr:acylphosphatase [Brockia lithotrophica]
MKRLFLRIVGRVQGVGYRAFVLREATRRGITGWVRNEPDGTVTAEVQGDVVP